MRKGRREEFKAAYAAFGDDVPDPLAEATFRSAVLDWDARATPQGRRRLTLVRDLLTIRRKEIAPRLSGATFGSARSEGGGAERAIGGSATAPRLRLIANVSSERQAAAPRRARRAPALGRRAGGHVAALVGVLEHRDGVMTAAVPIATYRLQLTPAFGFDQAAALVPYLKALGISHLYASPFLKARAGSTHGYDIVDHNAFNPELGGERGFRRLRDALAEADIGLILDFVPNHMARAPRRQRVVARRARMGPAVASCGRVRYRLDSHARPVARRRAAADPGKALRRGAGSGRDRAPVRSRARELLGLVLRAPAADRAAALWRTFSAGWSRRPTRRASRPAGGCSNWLPAVRDQRDPTRDAAAALKAELKATAGAAELIERGLAAYRPRSAR